ncbi:Ring-hydroxylating dioxygenase, large terminal subunit [Paraburkholderia ribeironis]|uniref:Ring-hydroxylating dioxygenase, large terminal subunit n=1 Tax=Paraburkholderia ribeironis TaxID=1247936 RepID=A0A1N7RTG3_9BURK|nr:aromatic ring-hydroxylating dioxygenase subunit alpha [Paraburkholderia ribeironis]SIT38402.1 Ring-hydroxylating dioxygenase, large terminal subunit [Paraburkholderia ribeironis]
MSEVPLKTLGELIRSREPGCGLPGGAFVRQDVFETDVDIFFHKHWILVGVTADIPEPGDVSVVDIGKASVILVRDDSENIRAYRNVCRHRGARLKEAGKSTVGMLVCPYHQWTYDLDGSLRHTKHMGKHFDPTCRSLLPVHIKVVGTHVFVCLADEPPADIAKLATTMAPRFAPYDLQNTRIAYEAEIIEDGNWKLVMENNRECYHCEAGHPELTVSFLPEDFGFSTDEMNEESLRALDEYHKRNAASQDGWEKEGLLCSPVEELSGDVATHFRTQRLVIAGCGESQTMDTRVACQKLLGNSSRRDLGDTHMWTHNSWTHVMSDHAMISYIIPLTPEKTLVRTKWLVHADAVEGVDYDINKLTEVWVATNAQDARLVAVNHRGAQDPGYIPGPYSQFTETYVDQFVDWYTARLKAHGL